MAEIKKESKIIKDNVVRLRGLPFEATKEDVEKFFGEDFNIVKDGILLPMSADGRASGQAYVQFDTEGDVSKAMEEKNKKCMGRRYIEIYASSMAEACRNSQKPPGERHNRDYMVMRNRSGRYGGSGRYPYGRGFGLNGPPCVAKTNSRSLHNSGQMNMFDGFNSSAFGNYSNGSLLNSSMISPFLNSPMGNYPNSKGGGMAGVRHKVEMRGLPFQASEQDVVSWFSDLVVPVNVTILYSKEGKPSGNAEVLFATEMDARTAMKKHKQNLQHRYIELYYVGPVSSSANDLMGNTNSLQMERIKKDFASSWENGWFSNNGSTNSGFKPTGGNTTAIPTAIGGGIGGSQNLGLESKNFGMGNFPSIYGYPFNNLPY